MRTLRAVTFSVLLVLIACNDVTFVERVVIANATDYPANVQVRGGSGGWLDLATVRPQETRTLEHVIDHGESWTFRFSYGGHAPVEIQIGRDELARNQWRVEVPLDFQETLRDQGVAPPP